MYYLMIMNDQDGVAFSEAYNTPEAAEDALKTSFDELIACGEAWDKGEPLTRGSALMPEFHGFTGFRLHSEEMTTIGQIVPSSFLKSTREYFINQKKGENDE